MASELPIWFASVAAVAAEPSYCYELFIAAAEALKPVLVAAIIVEDDVGCIRPVFEDDQGASEDWLVIRAEAIAFRTCFGLVLFVLLLVGAGTSLGVFELILEAVESLNGRQGGLLRCWLDSLAFFKTKSF